MGLLGKLTSYKRLHHTFSVFQQNNPNESVLVKHTLGLLGKLTSYKKEFDSMLQQNSSMSQQNQTQFKINSIFRIIKIVNIEDMHSVAKHPAYLHHNVLQRGDYHN